MTQCAATPCVLVLQALVHCLWYRCMSRSEKGRQTGDSGVSTAGMALTLSSLLAITVD